MQGDVDEDIDLVVADHRGDFRRRDAADLAPPRRRFLESLAEGIGRADGIGEDLKGPMVVSPERGQQGPAHHMVAEVRRDEADAETSPRIGRVGVTRGIRTDVVRVPKPVLFLQRFGRGVGVVMHHQNQVAADRRGVGADLGATTQQTHGLGRLA